MTAQVNGVKVNGMKATGVKLPQGAAGEAPRYFKDSEVGKVLSMLMALVGEVAVLRDRLDTVERLLAAGKPVTREAIDNYLPDEAVRQERDAWRQQYLSIIFRVLTEAQDVMSRTREPQTYAETIAMVENG